MSGRWSEFGQFVQNVRPGNSTASTYLDGDVVTIVLGVLRLFVHHHWVPSHDRPRSLTPLIVLSTAAAGAHHPLAGICVLDPSTPAGYAMLGNVASPDQQDRSPCSHIFSFSTPTPLLLQASPTLLSSLPLPLPLPLLLAFPTWKDFRAEIGSSPCWYEFEGQRDAWEWHCRLSHLHLPAMGAFSRTTSE